MSNTKLTFEDFEEVLGQMLEQTSQESDDLLYIKCLNKTKEQLHDELEDRAYKITSGERLFLINKATFINLIVMHQEMKK